MLKNIIEALIFASGHGMHTEKIISGLKDDFLEKDILEAISKLKNIYSGDSGVILIEAANVLQFQSNPKYGEILSDILIETRERELSKTLLQVLAIIAYKQPVTKAEIEDIRGGVNSDYAVSALLNIGLIDGIGRKETVGRPIIYGTTIEFLRKFGISSISDLPDYEELMTEIKNNFDKYYAKSEDLYRDTTANVVKEQNSIKDDSSDIPDFLKDEDIIEVE